MLEATSELNWAEHTGVIDVRKDYTSRFDNGLTVWHMSENVGEHIQIMSRRTLGTTLDVLINWKKHWTWNIGGIQESKFSTDPQVERPVLLYPLSGPQYDNMQMDKWA